jgi:NAD(P)-dependent dehydrogenase (short-subunit alcohol dehydrogenase family)
VLNTVEVAYPRMLDQGTGGSIVITGSMAAVMPMMRTLGGKTLGLLGYSAAKAALVNLTRNYASILAAHNIRVNIVHPTGVNTPMADNEMVRDRFETADTEDALTLVNAIPVNFVEATDIANAVAFLCSDEARYITGTALRVDAGSNLR